MTENLGAEALQTEIQTVPDQAPAPAASRREYVKYIRKTRRSITSTVSTARMALAGRAMAWCFPWERHHYPGFLRSCRQLFSRPELSRSTIWDWRTGRVALPIWAAHVLHDYIAWRVAIGEEIARELGDYIAAREANGGRAPRGWARVREDGRDRRGHTVKAMEREAAVAALAQRVLEPAARAALVGERPGRRVEAPKEAGEREA